jgi:phage gp46-like protein
LTTYFLSERPVLVCSEPDSLAGKTVSENGLGFWVKSGQPKVLLNKIMTLDLDKSHEVSIRAKKYAEEHLDKASALRVFTRAINETRRTE